MADIENIPVEDEVVEDTELMEEPTEGENAEGEPTENEVSLYDQFKEEVKTMTTEYFGYEVSTLVLQLAIEQFEVIRNYPISYTEEMRIADMKKNISKIAMAVVEIDSKDGAENQLTHNENGTSRSFYNGIMAYKDVIGFARIM